MRGIIDWLLDKMHLTDEETEEAAGRDSVFYKSVRSYEDCKLLIDYLRIGIICIYSIEADSDKDAEDMKNFISGGIYALGEAEEIISSNVYLVTSYETEK